MSDPKEPKSPEEVQREIQSFFKEKFGADILSVPIGGVPLGANAKPPSGAAPPAEEAAPEIPPAVVSFDMTPVQVKAYLDRYVVGQDEAKRALAVAVCDHYNHVRRVQKGAVAGEERPGVDNYVKQNVVLLGPTGVGKTYLIRILAQLIGVPFVKADSTKFSETGYVGGDVDDMVRELHRVADGNASLTEHGIIFLDEIDKIATAPNASTGRDPSGRGVQIALLKLMEETEVSLRNPMDISSQFQDMMSGRGKGPRSVNTRHILFVVSGAFSGLDEIIEKRLGEGSIGFGTVSATADASASSARARHLFAHATTKDFVDYGFEPEFVGRLPIRVSLDPLSETELLDILRDTEGSILHQYRDAFDGYGIEVAFEDDALADVAARAHDERTGARGLMTVLERALRDLKFSLPGTGVRRFAVTRELIANPRAVLESILEAPQAAEAAYAHAATREWEHAFARRHGVPLRFEDAAIEMAAGVADQLDLPIREYLENTFGDHRDFLAKILEQSGRPHLPVKPHFVHRPAEGVEFWLRGAEG